LKQPGCETVLLPDVLTLSWCALHPTASHPLPQTTGLRDGSVNAYVTDAQCVWQTIMHAVPCVEACGLQGCRNPSRTWRAGSINFWNVFDQAGSATVSRAAV